MSTRAKIALAVLIALNIVAFAINVSLPSRAAVGGMTYQNLVDDPDFTRAVQSIVQNAESTSTLPG